MKKTTAKEIVYQTIKSDILKGVIKCNEQIRENEYATRLGVSRTPLREALRNLEADGLLEYRVNRGMYVREFSIDDLQEMYDLRVAVETYINVQAFYRSSKEDYQALNNIIAETRIAYQSGNTDLVVEYFDQFHEQIAKISRLKIATEFLESLKSYMYIVRRYYLYDASSRFEQAINEHENLVRLMKEDKFEEFKKTIEDHIKKSQIVFFELYKNQNKIE